MLEPRSPIIRAHTTGSAGAHAHHLEAAPTSVRAGRAVEELSLLKEWGAGRVWAGSRVGVNRRGGFAREACARDMARDPRRMLRCTTARAPAPRRRARVGQHPRRPGLEPHARRGVPPSCVLRPIHLIPTPLTRSAAVTSTPPPFPRPASTPVMLLPTRAIRFTYSYTSPAPPLTSNSCPPTARVCHQQQHATATRSSRRRNRGLCNKTLHLYGRTAPLRGAFQQHREWDFRRAISRNVHERSFSCGPVRVARDVRFSLDGGVRRTWRSGPAMMLMRCP